MTAQGVGLTHSRVKRSNDSSGENPLEGVSNGTKRAGETCSYSQR